MSTGGNGEDGGQPRNGVGRLKHVNERLRDVIADLKSNRERLESRGERAEVAAAPPASVEAPQQALHRVEAELAAAREALELGRAEEERLRSRLVEIEREHRRICDDYTAAQEQSSDVTSLFVALSRLHATLERPEVLGAIQDVVVNVLGSEELALFELDPQGRLRAVHAMGVDASRLAEVPAGEGPIGRAALGLAFVARGDVPCEDGQLTACIPLRFGRRVIGALAIWRLLGHKHFLSDSDLELIELLSTHAGTALYAAGLHARQEQGTA